MTWTEAITAAYAAAGKAPSAMLLGHAARFDARGLVCSDETAAELAEIASSRSKATPPKTATAEVAA